MDIVRVDGVPHRARTAAAADPGADAQSRYGATARAFVWGVHAIVTKDARRHRRHGAARVEILNREGFSHEGDRVIVIAGVPFGTPARPT